MSPIVLFTRSFRNKYKISHKRFKAYKNDRHFETEHVFMFTSKSYYWLKYK